MKRNVMYRGVAMWVMPLEKKMRELYENVPVEGAE